MKNKVPFTRVKPQAAISSVLLAALFFSLLTGCGFKLRGDYLLSPELQTLYVSSVDQHGELTRIVKQQLSLYKVNVVKQSSKGIPQMHILADTLDRRTLSVFPNGQVAEYELIYAVQYQLRFDGQDSQTFAFEVNRDYQDDPNLPLAKSRELSLMLSEMRIEASDRILRDMATIHR